MEHASDDDSAKDEKMKASFESSLDKPEKKDTKKKKKAKHQSNRPTEKDDVISQPRRETASESRIFELLGIEKDTNKGNEPESIVSIEPVETIEIAEKYTQTNLPDAEQELAESPTNTVAEAAAVASMVFLKAFKAKLTSTPQVNEAVLDEVIEQSLGDLGIELDDTETDRENIILPPETEPIIDNEDEVLPTPAQPPLSQTPMVVSLNSLTQGGNEATSVPQPPTVEVDFRHRRSGNALLGGIIGYMMGRRRGRIRTENTFLPVQKKLEKQVIQLTDLIAAKELAVRSQVVREFNRTETLTPKFRKKVSEVRQPLSRPQSNENQVAQPEKPEKQEVRAPQKTIDTISLPLLLDIAEAIKLDGVSLRAMFENGSIDQKNLRKTMRQYLRGEPLEKIWPRTVAFEAEGDEEWVEQEIEAPMQVDGRMSRAAQAYRASELHGSYPITGSNASIPNHMASLPTPATPKLEDILDTKDKQPSMLAVLPIIVVTLAIAVVVVGIIVLL